MCFVNKINKWIEITLIRFKRQLTGKGSFVNMKAMSKLFQWMIRVMLIRC